MCGSIPAPLTAQPTMPSAVGAQGGGGTAAATTPNPTTTTANPATTTPAPATANTMAGGAPSKLPTTGGGAADGAANLQMQQVLASLVQAITALTELLKSMPTTGVNGASGGGPGQLPTQVPVKAGGPDAKGSGPATKAGGGCDTPAPAPLSGSGATTAPASNHANDGHGHH